MTRLVAGMLACCIAGSLCSIGQQKPAETTRRTPRLFAPQNLGLLEPPDREAWQQPDQVMDALHIAEGTVVADLGAGGGWFTVRLARRVGPNGRVYAVDVQQLMLEAIRRRVQREGYTNVVPVLGAYTDPRLPSDARTDAVLIVDAFHEMEDPVLLLRNVGTHAQTAGPHRHHRLPAGRRRARARSSRARSSLGGDDGSLCRGSSSDRRTEVLEVSVLPHLRQIAAHAHRVDHRGKRPERRRRYPGRPQDIRGARRLRCQCSHRYHVAEHDGSLGRRAGAARSTCESQIQQLFQDCEISAVKTGMLAYGRHRQVPSRMRSAAMYARPTWSSTPS